VRFAQPAPAATIVVVRIRVASHCRTSRDFLGAAVTRLKAVGLFTNEHSLLQDLKVATVLWNLLCPTLRCRSNFLASAPWVKRTERQTLCQDAPCWGDERPACALGVLPPHRHRVCVGALRLHSTLQAAFAVALYTASLYTAPSLPRAGAPCRGLSDTLVAATPLRRPAANASQSPRFARLTPCVDRSVGPVADIHSYYTHTYIEYDSAK